MNPYECIENLHKVDSLDCLVTCRKIELINTVNLPKDLIIKYLTSRDLIIKDLYKVKTRQELLKVFFALRMDYFIKDPSKVKSEDLYDSILQDEELFNGP